MSDEPWTMMIDWENRQVMLNNETYPITNLFDENFDELQWKDQDRCTRLVFGADSNWYTFDRPTQIFIGPRGAPAAVMKRAVVN